MWIVQCSCYSFSISQSGFLFPQRSTLSKWLCYLSVMQICLSKFTKLDSTQTEPRGVEFYQGWEDTVEKLRSTITMKTHIQFEAINSHLASFSSECLLLSKAVYNLTFTKQTNKKNQLKGNKTWWHCFVDMLWHGRVRFCNLLVKTVMWQQ